MGENGDTFAPAAERRAHPRNGRLATTTWSRSFEWTEACFWQNSIAAAGRPRVLFERESFPSSTTARIVPSSSKAAEVSWLKGDRPRIRMLDFPRWMGCCNLNDERWWTTRVRPFHPGSGILFEDYWGR